MSISLSCLRSLVFLLICSAAAPITNAQVSATQSPSQDIVRVDIELVQTPVMVLDAHGRFVNGLQRDQFELRIQGKPAQITFFEEISSHDSSTTQSTSARPRQFVFFVDDLHMSAETLASVRAGLLSFVDQQMQPNDQFAIISASGQIGFLQQFTDNAAVLRAAIGRLKPKPNVVHDTENITMSEYVAYRISQGDRAALTFYTNELLRSLQFTYALPKYGGKGAGFMVGSDTDQAERMVLRRAEAMIAQALPISMTTLSALENFLRASTQAKGRKTVFFISEGFLLHGRTGQLARAMERVNEAGALSNSVIYSVDARAFTLAQQASQMKLDSLGRQDVFASGESEALQGPPKEIATATGGKAIVRSKSIEGAVEDALKESAGYYLIAWRPENEEQKAEKFRNLSVTIAGRPELKTRLGAGYAVTGLKVAAKKARPVVTTPSTLQLPTRLSVGYLNTPSNGHVLTASTEMTIDLGVSEPSKPGSVEFAGVVLNDEGKVAADFQKAVIVQPLANDDSDETNVIYNHRIGLTPGIYQVKVAARHRESGRAGVSTQWIEIPDVSQGKLLLSTPLLEGSSGSADVPQFQNIVARRFSNNSRLNFMVFIYNAQRSAAPHLTADIRVTQNDRTALTIPPIRIQTEGNSDLQRIPFGGSFPLSSLRPGKYLLYLRVTDQIARTSVEQHIDFEIR